MNAIKVAILQVGGGALGADGAVRLASLLKSEGYYVVLGVPAGSPAENACRRNPGDWDELRAFDWQVMSGDDFEKVFEKSADKTELMARPVDGGLDFRDCDRWLVTGGMPPQVLAPLVDYGVVITDHAALLNSPEVEVTERAIGSVRGAEFLMFPDDFQVQKWRTAALAFEAKLLVGEIPAVKPVSKATEIRSPFSKYLVYFPTRNQNELLPISALLLADLDGTEESQEREAVRKSFWYDEDVDEDDICPPEIEAYLVPLLDLEKTPDRLWPEWNKNQPIAVDKTSLASLITQSELVVSGPFVDPVDCRLQAAKAAGKPVAMLWRANWGELPEHLNMVSGIITGEKRCELEQDIARALSAAGSVKTGTRGKKAKKPGNEALDGAALEAVLGGGGVK